MVPPRHDELYRKIIQKQTITLFIKVYLTLLEFYIFYTPVNFGVFYWIAIVAVEIIRIPSKSRRTRNMSNWMNKSQRNGEPSPSPMSWLERPNPPGIASNSRTTNPAHSQTFHGTASPTQLNSSLVKTQGK